MFETDDRCWSWRQDLSKFVAHMMMHMYGVWESCWLWLSTRCPVRAKTSGMWGSRRSPELVSLAMCCHSTIWGSWGTYILFPNWRNLSLGVTYRMFPNWGNLFLGVCPPCPQIEGKSISRGRSPMFINWGKGYVHLVHKLMQSIFSGTSALAPNWRNFLW